MTTNEDKEIDDVIYSYSTSTNQLEDENKLLRETIQQLNRELEKMRDPPLMASQVREVFDEQAIIQIPNGNEFLVNITKDAKDIKIGDTVFVEQKNLTIIKKAPSSKKFSVEQFVIIEKPTIMWKDIGGLKKQANEIQEVVELPLKNPELFKKVGIKPPKGVLLYGPPGTGKTLLAKAVAKDTNSTFIQIVGSELVQKFIGEGAKLVKEVFELAREKAPAIIFIDEIDSLAAKRIELGTSGEREVQRTFMQLLAEIDGFKPLDNIKIIAATNRKDILDPAVTRPGRLDRLIKVDAPDKEGLQQIFKIHTKDMKLDRDVEIGPIIEKMIGFTGAEVKAACTEAGYFAIREKRTTITKKDILQGIEKVKMEEALEGDDYLGMFG